MSTEESTPISSLQNDNSNDNQDINDIINKIEKDNEAPKENPNLVQQEQKSFEEINNQEDDEEEYSMFDVIYNEISYPILVAVIYIILSFTQIDDLLCMYIKFICKDTGEMNIFGVILKSIFAAILFYIFGKYVV